MQVYKPTLTRFVEAGGLIGNSPAEVCKGNWGHKERYNGISQYMNECMEK